MERIRHRQMYEFFFVSSWPRRSPPNPPNAQKSFAERPRRALRVLRLIVISSNWFEHHAETD